MLLPHFNYTKKTLIITIKFTLNFFLPPFRFVPLPVMLSALVLKFPLKVLSETACETSPVKVHSLSLHLPAAFTRTSSNFWTSVPFATLSVFPSLICGSCPSGQRFAYSFFQIPSHGGHPCFRLYPSHYRADSGLTPVRNVRRQAHKKSRPVLMSERPLSVM